MVPSVKKMSGKIGHEFPSFFVVPCTCPVQEAWMSHCEAANLDCISREVTAVLVQGLSQSQPGKSWSQPVSEWPSWPWWIFATITSFANTSIGEAGATMSTWSWKSLATLGSSAPQGKVTGSWPGKAVGEAAEIQADVVSRSKWGTSVAVLVSGCGSWTLPGTMAGGSPAPMAAGASCR